MKASTSISYQDRLLGGLWGSLVGDALGVPVEFIDRTTVQLNPVTSLREYGTHHQPRGTWSDDGAMILCAADSLVNHEFDLADMGSRFVRWMNQGLWTANGDVFDVGGTTASALMRIGKGVPADQAGGHSEDCNGNGSLMRILPVTLRFAGEPISTHADRLEKSSAVTHAHARSQMSCVFYGLVIRQLLAGAPPLPAVQAARTEFTNRYRTSAEFSLFRHILEDDLVALPEYEVLSTGYVIHTLHASLWCLLSTGNFRDCVLKAVNLGGDTDTTGCVAGGLAGVAYGLKSIPAEWIQQLARKGHVDCLFHEFAELCQQHRSKP